MCVRWRNKEKIKSGEIKTSKMTEVNLQKQKKNTATHIEQVKERQRKQERGKLVMMEKT